MGYYVNKKRKRKKNKQTSKIKKSNLQLIGVAQFQGNGQMHLRPSQMCLKHILVMSQTRRGESGQLKNLAWSLCYTQDVFLDAECQRHPIAGLFHGNSYVTAAGSFAFLWVHACVRT